MERRRWFDVLRDWTVGKLNITRHGIFEAIALPAGNLQAKSDDVINSRRQSATFRNVRANKPPWLEEGICAGLCARNHNFNCSPQTHSQTAATIFCTSHAIV